MEAGHRGSSSAVRQFEKEVKVKRSDNALEFIKVALEQKTPYEMIMNKKPVYSNLKVFGCLAVTSNPNRTSDKMAPRGVPCLFLGYPHHQKEPTNHNVVPNTQNDAEPAASSIPEVITSVPSTNFEQTAPVLKTRRSGRQHVTLTWLKDYMTPSHVPRANQADSSSFTAVLVYVDGILITGTSPLLMQELKKLLSITFRIKDLGDLSYFLGLEVCKNDQGIFISQKKYTTNLLKENGVLNAKPYKLPMDQHVKLQADIGTPLPDPEVYRRLIGKLIISPSPDICYIVQLLSQFMQNPTSIHMQAVKHLLRYLLSAHGQGIILAKSSAVYLTTYCDSN
nr:cysteine-rich RLK (receptor-like protein kinase) 8 [Tanacetum cinerariifolium]